MEYKSLFIAFVVLLVVAVGHGEGEEKGEEMTQSCLGCICDAASECNTTIGCTGDVCGPFRITKTYWADGGKPSIDGNSDGDDGAYNECANDAECAAKAVKAYTQKYAQDCNGDGVINCNDYARLHHLGGFGCKGTLDETYESTFSYCQKIFEQL